MAYLVWVKSQQLCFADDHEYYRALGGLCQYGAYTITFETNSQTESWGDAFRIKCMMNDNQVPDAFIRAMRNARRINCNDYVQNLYECHDFDFDISNKVLNGDYNKVKRTVPTSYYTDFDEGYHLRFTRYGSNTTQQKNTVTKAAHSTPQSVSTYAKIKRGDKVIHKTYGIGQMTKIKGSLIYIKFGNEERSFQYPEGFTKGFLTMM